MSGSSSSSTATPAEYTHFDWKAVTYAEAVKLAQRYADECKADGDVDIWVSPTGKLVPCMQWQLVKGSPFTREDADKVCNVLDKQNVVECKYPSHRQFLCMTDNNGSAWQDFGLGRKYAASHWLPAFKHKHSDAKFYVAAAQPIVLYTL
jgi:hypothetical protein